MPTYIRWRDDGAAYFFTVVTYHRRAILTSANARTILKRAMATVRQRWPFDMPACVLLPDHLHCVWQLPEGDDDLPVRWANIKRAFTQRYLEAGGRGAKVSPGLGRHHQRGVWQPRYWEHRIRDEEDWRRHCDYIHFNPIKHGHVEDLSDWPWSSFHRYVQQGVLDPDWPGAKPLAMPDTTGE